MFMSYQCIILYKTYVSDIKNRVSDINFIKNTYDIYFFKLLPILRFGHTE